MTTRSILGLIYNLKAFESMGIAVADVLARHGLPLESVDPASTVERPRELLILAELLQRTDDPDLALKLGIGFSLAGYGPLSMLLMSCANGFEAVKTGIRYQRLTYLFGEISLELRGYTSLLRFEPVSMPEEVRRFAIDRDLAGIYKLVRDISAYTGQVTQLREAWFSYSRPEQFACHEKIFGCRVRFDQICNGLVLDNADLNRPFPGANAAALELYRAQCDQLLKKYSEVADGMAQRVTKYLEMYRYTLPSIKAVAETFGCSERTLRRQLSREETSYQTILNSVRFRKAIHYLKHSTLPVEQIALRLGYGETASFNHAFQRWSGTSPSKYRGGERKHRYR